jgi:hypothetical protein
VARTADHSQPPESSGYRRQPTPTDASTVKKRRHSQQTPEIEHDSYSSPDAREIGFTDAMAFMQFS